MVWSTRASSVLALGLLMLAGPATAGPRVQGLVAAAEGRRWYVDYEPGPEGAPVVVLVNGLTYDVDSWSQLREAMDCSRCGLLRVDLLGQGRTLIDNAPTFHAIPYAAQVAGLHGVLRTLGIKMPLVLAGLSYGGGVALAYAAAHPARVRDLVLLAPFTAPIPGQDAWIRTQVASTRLFQPWNPATDDELYDFFLRQLVYSSYPFAEPVLLSNPFKLEAAFRMVAGIRKIDAVALAAKVRSGSLHLVVAGADEYIPRALMDQFWNAVPRRVKASRVVLDDARHKLPEVAPIAVAAWLRRVVEQDAELRGGVACAGTSCSGAFSCEPRL